MINADGTVTEFLNDEEMRQLGAGAFVVIVDAGKVDRAVLRARAASYEAAGVQCVIARHE